MSNIIMPVASDKFSELTDDLLCIILSKLPIREAVRCSVLAKRWRFLYNQIPKLTLSPYLVLGRTVTPSRRSISTAENIIFSILLLHSPLEAFHLFDDTVSYPIYNNQWQFTRQSVWKWVQYAASKNVQQLHLRYSRAQEIPPPALFFCTHLTSLTLYNYILTHIPTDFSGFKHLITCSLEEIEFTDESLACFTSHCPLLQTFEMAYCTGLQNPVISAPNITHLEYIPGDDEASDTQVLTVNCPKIRTMEAFMTTEVTVNGVLLEELSCAVVLKLELQNGINLIGLELVTEDNLSAQRLLDIVGNFKSLRKLDINTHPFLETEQEMTVPLISLLQRLPHLELLKIRKMFLHELTGDEIPPNLNRPLANLSYLLVEINEFSQKEMDVMNCLLRNAPRLQNLKLELPKQYKEAQYRGFLQNLLHLKEALQLPFTIL